MTFKNREYAKEYMRKWRKKNPKRTSEISKKSKYRDFGKYRELGKIREKNRRIKLRKIVISHYSLGENKCACCGENQFEFLTVDHIDGGGTKHRKQIGRGALCEWLVSNKFPKGFQILCYNCNCTKGIYGECPHKLTTLSVLVRLADKGGATG